MDKVEARGVLDRRIAELRLQPYSDLKAAWLGQPDCEQVPGPSGVEYQIEIEAVWDDAQDRNLRIIVSIDDGGLWSAFAPLTDAFVVAPDGSFLGE